MITPEDKEQLQGLCQEVDENLVDALVKFYKAAKVAKEEKRSGQIVTFVKDGSLETIVGIAPAERIAKSA